MSQMSIEELEELVNEVLGYSNKEIKYVLKVLSKLEEKKISKLTRCTD